MPTKLIFSVPVFNVNDWSKAEHYATLEIVSEVDSSLAESYTFSQEQINRLLALMNCEVQLAKDLEKMSAEIHDKQKQLKALNFKIKQKQLDFDGLLAFFRRQGIRTSDTYQTFRVFIPAYPPSDDDDDDDDYEFDIDESSTTSSDD